MTTHLIAARVTRARVTWSGASHRGLRRLRRRAEAGMTTAEYGLSCCFRGWLSAPE